MEHGTEADLTKVLEALEPGIKRLIYEMSTTDMKPARLQALLSKQLTDGLDGHAKALIKAAEASDKYSRRLVGATWALVLATVALVLVEVLPLIGCGKG